MLVLFILNGHVCFGNGSKTDSLFRVFRNDIRTELQENGRVVWDLETVESYCTMMRLCPKKELIPYTDDPIPEVRSLVFSGLAQRGFDQAALRKIADRHIQDTASFVLNSTDVTVKWTVSSFMQSALNPEKSSQHINFEQRLDYARAQRKNVKVFVPSTYHNTIDKKALIKADSLLESDSGWVVKSFLMTANGITLKSTNRITQEIRNLIASLRVGDNIIIEEIVVEAPDKSWRSINPIVIKLR